MNARILVNVLVLALLASCSGAAAPPIVSAPNDLSNSTLLGRAAKSAMWGAQITADSMGAVGVFQYAICDTKIYKSKAPCMHEYHDAPFKMTASMSNHAAVNWKGCSSTTASAGYGTCGTSIHLLSALGSTQIKGLTYTTPPSMQEGGSTAEYLYASPGFTDVATVESSTLAKGTPVQIKLELTLEVTGTHNVCENGHFYDVSVTANDTTIYGSVNQTYMQQITGGCNPKVFVLKAVSNAGTPHLGQTTGPKLTISAVIAQPVGAVGPILGSTFYQTGTSSSAGGKRAQTSVGMLITYHLQPLTKGVTIKTASGHTYI